MPILYAPTYLRGLRALGLALSAVLILAGCAKQKSDSSDRHPIASATATDAASQARNAHNRGVVSAPSQLQLDLNPNDTPSAPVVGHAAFIPQPQTYLGTLPCFRQALNCAAQRLTLTLAPNGRWRARVGYLHATRSTDVIEQGCWRGIREGQTRLILTERNGNVRAELIMTQSKVLRVRTVNGEALSLAYNLTRQPDLDPIDTPTATPAPICD